MNPLLLGIAGIATYLAVHEARRKSHATSKRLRRNPATAYDVFLNRKRIDTVFQSGKSDADEVKRSLVNHDGYDPDIVVRKARRRKVKANPGRSRFTSNMLERELNKYNAAHGLTDATGKFILDSAYNMTAVRWQIAGKSSQHDVTGLGTPREALEKWYGRREDFVKRYAQKSNPKRRKHSRRNPEDVHLSPRPKIGQHVSCPADRGDAAFNGHISHIGLSPQSHGNRKFYWITVRRSGGRSGGVWPSHRLGFRYTGP